MKPKSLPHCAVLFCFLGCLIGFLFLAFLTATSGYIRISYFLVQSFYIVFPLGHAFFGAFALLLLLGSSFFLMVLYSWQKWASALSSLLNVFQFFDLPVLVGYELWILTAGTAAMPIHVVLFLANTPLANIATNWFVLISSCIMLVTSLLIHRSRFTSKLKLVYIRAFKW